MFIIDYGLLIILYLIGLLIFVYLIKTAVDSSETAKNIKAIRMMLEEKHQTSNDSNTEEELMNADEERHNECPACHYIVSPEDNICPSCGLTLYIENESNDNSHEE